MANEKEKQPILLTKEQIRDFIKILISKGRSPGSVQSYKSILNTLYDYLPDDHFSRCGASIQKYMAGQTDRAGLAAEIESYWSSTTPVAQ